MNPYLECSEEWAGFHHSFLVYWSEALWAAIPSDYLVKIRHRINAFEKETVVSDVIVPRSESTSTVPVELRLPDVEPVHEPYIEILRRRDRSLVTVLELLSPSNKEMPGRRSYLEKRNLLLSQHVNIVELD
jgi:hypothetical protein